MQQITKEMSRAPLHSTSPSPCDWFVAHRSHLVEWVQIPHKWLGTYHDFHLTGRCTSMSLSEQSFMQKTKHIQSKRFRTKLNVIWLLGVLQCLGPEIWTPNTIHGCDLLRPQEFFTIAAAALMALTGLGSGSSTAYGQNLTAYQPWKTLK